MIEQKQITCPPETKFLQHVGDNTDHEFATIDYKNTQHGLGTIAMANSNFSHQNIKR